MTDKRARRLFACCALALGALGVMWAVRDRPSADLVETATAAPELAAETGSASSGPATAPGASSGDADAETAPRPGVPARIVMADLGVDAPIVSVGNEDDGSMQVPGVDEAGWYQHGPRPGSPEGSSVVAAHVDFGGERGVFFDLRTVQVGSEVLLYEATGAERRFTVVEAFQVDKDELPIDELFRTDGAHSLTLITCGGAFDRSGRTYEDNVVVRAIPA